MKFKQCKFHNKKEIRKETKCEIYSFLKSELPIKECNQGLLLQYIDLLLDESDYDIKNNKFYYRAKGFKLDLPVKLLKEVALEYIKEHMIDFLLEKNKTQ